MPGARHLRALSEALDKADQKLDVAEAMAEAYELDPAVVSLNNLAVAWSKAGQKSKAHEIYERAFAQGNVYAGVNLAAELQWTDAAKYRALLTQAFAMDPDDYWVLYNYGRVLKTDGDEAWKVHWQKALDAYVRMLQAGELRKDNARRGLEIATALQKSGEKQIFEQCLRELGDEHLLFDENNTVRQATTELGAANLKKLS